METSLTKLLEDPLNTDYTNYIDIESFAKWYLAVELTGNYDPNMFFVMQTKGSKLEMAPLWDAEWSLGLWSLVWGEAPNPLVDDKIAKTIAYFPYLLRSPLFNQELCRVWKEHKSELFNVRNLISQLCSIISLAQECNNLRWPVLDINPNVKFARVDEEITYMVKYFNDRYNTLDNTFN